MGAAVGAARATLSSLRLKFANLVAASSVDSVRPRATHRSRLRGRESLKGTSQICDLISTHVRANEVNVVGPRPLLARLRLNKNPTDIVNVVNGFCLHSLRRPAHSCHKDKVGDHSIGLIIVVVF